LVFAAIVAIGALATAGLAGAASSSVHVKVTTKAISITGSRSATNQVVQISFDPKTCASYAVESKRNVQFSDYRSTKTGAFTYRILRSGLHLAKPKPHYACLYLLDVRGGSITEVASASAKM